MPRFLAGLIFICLFIFLIPAVHAADNNFITPIFPVRARQYWRQGKDIQEIKRLYDLVIKYKLSSSWLLHYESLFDRELTEYIPKENVELGIFLEVTRKLAEDSFVKYDWEQGNWSQANKVFLSGYTRDERQRMIDKVFSVFKDKFGYYPKSYGAWYVDVWSMEYIRDKYGADVVLGLADQYSTDGYQTWGQYFDLPYFVSKQSAIEPAENDSDSTKVLKLQWAPRNPVLSYGLSNDQSNYSTQVNDYHRGKNLDQKYFVNLLKDITIDVPGKISQATIGIEAGELEEKYYPELEAQLKSLREFEDKKLIHNVTIEQFNNEYRKIYSSVSPESTITATESGTTVQWFMSPQLRYGIWEKDGKKEYFDLRFYHTSRYRDNDQFLPDLRPNLVRLVPAVIDELVYHNSTSSAGLTPPKSIVLNPGDSIYGHYSGKFTSLKSLLVKLAIHIPDIIYSSIDSQKYLGLRIGYESFIGVRFPKIKFGRFEFKFPVLENFISIKQKLYPNFAWTGKQEIELAANKDDGEVKNKGWVYGQDTLATSSGHIIYENSYYQVSK